MCFAPFPANTKHLYKICTLLDQRHALKLSKGVGRTLYKCYTNVLCLLGRPTYRHNVTLV